MAASDLSTRLDDRTSEAAARYNAARLTRPLSSYADPLAELRAARSELPPGGRLVCSTTNAASSEGLVQLLRSDPAQAGPYTTSSAQQFHGYATAIKLMLEAGFSPDIVDTVSGQAHDELLSAAVPLLEHLRVDTVRARRHLGAQGYLLLGEVVTDVDEDLAIPVAEQRPVTFVACVNDELQLENNLLASPVFGAGSPHQLLTYREMTSAAEGLNRGLHAADHDLVVFIQQDIYIPSWWPARLHRQWAIASHPTAPSLAGPFGVRYREGGREHVGHAVDRDSLLRMSRALPASVDGLDELVLVVPRDTDLRVEPRVGWHLYGADLALQAHRSGGWTAVLDLPCHHNSLVHSLDGGYKHSEAVLASKWRDELPIITNSSTIDEDPRDRRVRDLEEFINSRHDDVTTLAAELGKAQQDVAQLSGSLHEAQQEIGRLNEDLRSARGRNRKLRRNLERARGEQPS